MAKASVLAGTTSFSVTIFIQDSLSAIGAGLPGLAFNSSGLVASYTFTGANAGSVAITLATLAAVNSAYSSGGFKEINNASPDQGNYRLDIPNAALAAGKGQLVTISLAGATNMAPLKFEIELTGWNNQDGVHGGLSALPNTAVTTNASLLTSGSGTDQLAVASGRVDTGKISGTAQTARDIGASVLLSAGSGTGQLDFTSGVVKANLAQILGTALTETAGQIAAAFKQFFNIASPTSTMNVVTTVTTATTTTTATNLTNAPTAGDFTATMKTSLNAATPAVTVSDKTGFSLTSGERSSIADATLDRDMSTGADSGSTTVRTMRQALRFLRNKWAISGGTLTVYKEDDATSSWTSSVTTDGTAQPIVSNDPAGP